MLVTKMPEMKATWLLGALLASLMVITVFAVTAVAPTEDDMGDTQRILYVHVPIAWLALLSFAVMTIAGIQYLRHRDLAWDCWTFAAAELGWLCCGLTLVTGSLWAREEWGTWWTWDPRLTTLFVLWMIYSGCLLARGSMSDAHQRARICASLAMLGSIDLPLVIMATRWFRGIHPVSPAMEPTMRFVLYFSLFSFSVFFVVLLVCRARQIRLETMLPELFRALPSRNSAIATQCHLPCHWAVARPARPSDRVSRKARSRDLAIRG